MPVGLRDKGGKGQPSFSTGGDFPDQETKSGQWSEEDKNNTGRDSLGKSSSSNKAYGRCAEDLFIANSVLRRPVCTNLCYLTSINLFKSTREKDPWDNDCLLCSARGKWKLILKTQPSILTLGWSSPQSSDMVFWRCQSSTHSCSVRSPRFGRMARIPMFPGHCITSEISAQPT